MNLRVTELEDTLKNHLPLGKMGVLFLFYPQMGVPSLGIEWRHSWEPLLDFIPVDIQVTVTVSLSCVTALPWGIFSYLLLHAEMLAKQLAHHLVTVRCQ